MNDNRSVRSTHTPGSITSGGTHTVIVETKNNFNLTFKLQFTYKRAINQLNGRVFYRPSTINLRYTCASLFRYTRYGNNDISTPFRRVESVLTPQKRFFDWNASDC